MTTTTPSPATPSSAAAARPAPSRRRFRGRLADLGIAIVTLLVATVLLIGTLGMEVRGTQAPGPQFFPFIVCGLLYAVGLILLIGLLRQHASSAPEWHRPDVSEDMLRDLGANTELIRVDEIERETELEAAHAAGETPASDAAATPEDADTAHPIDWRTLGITVGALVFFIVTLEFLGWIIAGAVLFWLIAFAFGSKRHIFDAGVAVLASSLIQLAFVAGLGLTLPSGILGVLF